MNLLLWGLDLTLAATLLTLARAVLFGRDDFRTVVLFICLGLVMALVWVRLAAPEVALAEAAVGAGISGAMLLSALSRLSPAAAGPTDPADPADRKWLPQRLTRYFCLLGAAGLTLTGGILLLLNPAGRSGPDPALSAALPASGVSNQVTAVLLNFRSYDTLLELAVLLLAVIATRALTDEVRPPATAGDGGQNRAFAHDPILLTLIRGVMPLAILIAGYLVWIGDRSPGGAFQGGAVLGGAAILLGLAGRPVPDFCPRPLLRAGLVTGLLVFLGLAALPLLQDRLFFQYPPELAGFFILTIEAAAAPAIALALFLLVHLQQHPFQGPDQIAPKREPQNPTKPEKSGAERPLATSAPELPGSGKKAAAAPGGPGKSALRKLAEDSRQSSQPALREEKS